MRPLLLPSVRRLWRDATTLQLRADPARAVVLAGVDGPTAALLALLDGRRPLEEVLDRAARKGLPEPVAEDLLAGLMACGTVVDAELDGAPPLADGSGLAPDLAALSLTLGAAARRRLTDRRRRAVLVRARGRIGPVIGAVLAASGVGRVAMVGSGRVAPGDAAVGGLLHADVGKPYAAAAAAAVRRAATTVDTRALGPARVPDVVVLADEPVPSPGDRIRWTARRVPHLPVALRDGTALVGPFVLPGRTACLDCVDRHRRDRDPVWPALAAQLATDPTPEPCQTAVATAAASVAALQVLAHLDGRVPEAAGATLELVEPGERVRRRPWDLHPECGCAGSGRSV